MLVTTAVLSTALLPDVTTRTISPSEALEALHSLAETHPPSLPPPYLPPPPASGSQLAGSQLYDELYRTGYHRLAIVITICNGTDYVGSPPDHQISRVRRALGCFGTNESVKILNTGFRLNNISGVEVTHVPPLHLKPRFNDRDKDHLWVPNNAVQHRLDGNCTATKFHAWNLTEFDAVAVVDSDVCLRPLSLMNSLHAFSKSDKIFAASPERAFRKYNGFNTHLMFLKPNRHIFNLLIDKAASSDFVPYTNTEQDVLETVFSPTRHAAKFPWHIHSKNCRCL